MIYSIDTATPLDISEIYEIERHTVWHCAYEKNTLVLILDGVCTFRVEKKEMTLSAGDILLIPAGQDCERRPADENDVRLLYVHFNSLLVHIPKEDEKDELSRFLLAKDAGYLLCRDLTAGMLDCAPILRHALSLFHGILPLKKQESSLCLLEVLLLISRNSLARYGYSSIREETTVFPKHVEACLQYVREHLREPIELADLYTVASVSPQHLIRLFDRYLGMPPIRYINSAKIHAAIEMLRTSELSVAQIAYELGYDSPNYFARVFKKEIGVSPTKKREFIRAYDTKPSKM